jgi:hypothetical protein
VPDDQFIEVIKNSISIAESLRKLGQSQFGAAYKFFKQRVKDLKIDTSHFVGKGYAKGKKREIDNKRHPLDKLLVQNSSVLFRTAFKRRLIKEGFLKENCAQCNIGTMWCDKPITLQIDHINGDCFDHRIDNLRLLCPNCHSQTSTFCRGDKESKNKTEKLCGVEPPIREYIKYYCVFCNKEVKRKGSKSCKECYDARRSELQTPYIRWHKINWPPIQELLERLLTTSYLQLGNELGVSDNAIRKHIKNNS